MGDNKNNNTKTITSTWDIKGLKKDKNKQCYRSSYTTKTTSSYTFLSLDNDGHNEEESDNTNNNTKTITSTWDIKGLKKENQRVILRCVKKIQKASIRLRNAQEQIEKLLEDGDTTLEELESSPPSENYKIDLELLQSRLKKLNILEEGLMKIKKKKDVLPQELAILAIELEVNDIPFVQPVRTAKKKNKQTNTGPRKPYKRYYTTDGTEIRVGKQAEDNDQLSISREHRSSSNWWMHASGCPGSHVVIRLDDNNLSSDVINDAAALAARQSKCTGGVIKVSLTRCRNISKPPGAKAGLVYINGDVKTVKVNMDEAKGRLDRLDKTMLVN